MIPHDRMISSFRSHSSTMFFPFLLILASSILPTSLGDHHSQPSSSSSSSSAPSIFRLHFDPFRASTEYRCGAFAEQQGPQKDPAMRMLHTAQNALIHALSQPFPHQKLLSDEALLGRPEAWRRSLVEHRDPWIQFDRWWLLLALGFAFIPPAFVLLFLAARCCFCLCQRGKKKAANGDGDGPMRQMDRRWDWLRRLALNAAIGILILANVFCAATLLLSTQYAQHGLDELPTRLHYCANDLLVYRSETAEQIRKLLRDDFVRFNQSIQAALDGLGHALVQRLKEETGVDRLEQAVIRASNAPQIRGQYQQLEKELGRALDLRHSLQTRLLRLRQAREGLADCERTARSGDRAALCHQARQALLPLVELANEGPSMGEWESAAKLQELSALVPDQLPTALAQLERVDIERRFAVPLEGLQLVEHGIQLVVDSRREDADERLRLLDRTLQSHYDQISSAIKSVDLRFLDEQLLDPMMRQRDRFRHMVQYGWLAAMAIAGLFAFLSLAFLLGLCFGCCGRRPSEFDDDDCCVRSTGANFFGCSIWLALALLSVFGLVSALAMLLGANAAHLICHPLRQPLDRPDILSLADRLVTVYGLDQPPPPASSSAASKFSQIFTAKRRPADLIQGCAQGRTLYEMFDMDARFALLGQGGPADEYEEMANSIRQLLLSGRLLEEAIGRSSIAAGGGRAIQQGGGGAAPFGARWIAFSAEMRQALEALGQVQMPDWEEGAVKEFCAQKSRFQLETILTELRRLKQSAEEQAAESGGQNGGGGGAGGPVQELESVLRFLEELRPETVQVRALLEESCTHLDKLRADLLSLRFNSSSLLADLERIQAALGSEQEMRQKIHAVAGELAGELAGMVRAYGQHVNQSMHSEVSSCAPLTEIARHTRAAVCDYALDPLNTLWLALGLGVSLFLPIILLASTLNPLYRRTNAYPKYIVPSMSSDSPNDARFATDIYGLGPASYGTSTTLKAGHHHQQQPPHALSACTQITSPYATANYGYQELVPPIYMGTARR